MANHDFEGPGHRPSMADELRRSQDAIVQEWEDRVRALPAERHLPRPVLRDHIPDLLAEIAHMTAERAAGRPTGLPAEVVDRHVLQRLDSGFDLREVVAEYAALRAAVLEILGREKALPAGLEAAAPLHQAIDTCIAASVERFTNSRDRTLAALDRISLALLETRDLDGLLRQLLEVFIQTTEAVDSGVILLREGDRLVVRAAVGLEGELAAGFSLGIGAGFAGTIAAERRPLFIGSPAGESLLPSTELGARGVRALYGVPLLEHDDLVGVAHMGSSTAAEFSEQDRQLLRALSMRATSAIVQQQLRDRLERERADLVVALDETEMQRRRYRDLVDNLDHAVVWEADARTLRFTFVSGRAGALNGMRPEEWMEAADFWRDQVPPEDHEKVLGLFERCRTLGADDRVDHRLLTRDGRVLWVHTGVHSTVVSGSQQLQGVSMDISEVREALAAREDILYVVSHDLRNPLNAITLATLQLIRTLPLNAVFQRAREAAEISLRSARRMNRLIGDLVDLAGLRAGNLSVNLHPWEPMPLVEEAVAGSSAAAAEKGLDLASDWTKPLPTVLCDHDRVLQILSNLIDNAIKVTPAGGRIRVGAAAGGGEVCFSVIDSGPGIPVEHRIHLFERYWRPRSDDRGAGIGLAIVKGLVEAHHGRVWVESEVGAGSAFFFTIPAQEAHPSRSSE